MASRWRRTLTDLWLIVAKQATAEIQPQMLSTLEEQAEEVRAYAAALRRLSDGWLLGKAQDRDCYTDFNFRQSRYRGVPPELWHENPNLAETLTDQVNASLRTTLAVFEAMAELRRRGILEASREERQQCMDKIAKRLQLPRMEWLSPSPE
jgi:hypothetical protein